MRRVLGLLAFAAFASPACYTMASLTWEEISVQRPTNVWVTRDDRSVVVMNGPQVFGDTLVGYIGGQFYELPTADIERVTIKRSAKGKTIALVAASIAGAAAIGVVISGLGEQSFAGMVDCNDEPDDPRCQGMGP